MTTGVGAALDGCGIKREIEFSLSVKPKRSFFYLARGKIKKNTANLIGKISIML